MAFLTEEEIAKIGFKSCGKNLKIDSTVSIFRPELISIGDDVRIDSYATLANNISLGSFVHISASCYLISSPKAVIDIRDFSCLGVKVTVITSSDDFSGPCLFGPSIPQKYRNESHASVVIEPSCIIGIASTILPGVTLGEGSSIGSMSLVKRDTPPFSVSAGMPARQVGERSRDMLKLREQFLEEWRAANK